MIGRIRLAAALILILECVSRSPAGEPCHYTWTRIFPPPGGDGGEDEGESDPGDDPFVQWLRSRTVDEVLDWYRDGMPH